MNSITASSKDTYCLVDFSWGPTFTEYWMGVTDANAQLYRDGKRYLPDPSMSINLAESTGGIKDKEIRITMMLAGQNPELNALLSGISCGRAWPITRVRVREIQMSPSDGSEERMLYLFDGTLSRATRNPSGNPNIVELECAWEKTQLDGRRFGIAAFESCSWVYGGEGCRKRILQYPQTISNYGNAYNWHYVRLSNFGGATATLVADSGSTTEQQAIVQGIDKWSDGFLESEGLRIGIREYRPSTPLFLLERVPPPSWDYAISGRVLKLFPGCKRTPKACEERENVANFGGFGWGMPAYNPMTEETDR